jgi:tetratricopeptide (TPR) repeat protein
MDPVEPPDAHYLNAAIGWLELGNPTEARAELDNISPANQMHPDVLEVRWLICAELKDWPAALASARALIERAPERPSGWLHFAYALRRVPEGGLQKAWDALQPAYEKFPNEPIIAFNLACYACQLGRLTEARQWFKRAIAIGDPDKLKQMALGDPDLEPLWPEINSL